MMHPRAGQDIHRFIFETSSQLRNAGDPERVLRHYLRAAVDFMQADRGYVAALGVGDETAAFALHGWTDGSAERRRRPVWLRALVALVPRLAGPTTSVEAGSTALLAMLRQELARFAGGRPLDDDLTLALVRRL